MNNKCWIASFDIGKKNFAFVIEEVDLESLKSIKNINKEERYNKDGTPTSQFSKILEELYKCGKIILIKNIDLTTNLSATKQKSYLDPKIYINMIDELDKYTDYWGKCTHFIIEKQMSFGKKHNTMALKLGQHCYSYFCFFYRDFKKVIEYPAYHKTQVLGAEKNEIKQKYYRKKWAVKKATEIITTRDDKYSLEVLNDKKKRDDMSDCLLMTITFSYLCFVNKTKF
jgi:hypothetical protein